jgi:hypothetical protein
VTDGKKGRATGGLHYLAGRSIILRNRSVARSIRRLAGGSPVQETTVCPFCISTVASIAIGTVALLNTYTLLQGVKDDDQSQNRDA